MKKFLFLFLFFSFCTEKKEPKVVVVLPLSGKYSFYGKEAELGVKFFLKKHKNLSFSVEIFDFKSDSQSLKKILEGIFENPEILCVIGPLTSKFALFASKIVEEKGIPLITPTATNPEVTRDKKWIFRMTYSDEEQGTILAKFVRKYLGLERAGIFYIKDDPYSSVLTRFFKETFEKEGGKIVGIEEFKGDIEPRIISIKNTNPQILFAPLYLEEIIILIEKCIKREFTPLFIGGDSWYSNEFIERLKNYIDNIKVFISSPFHPDRKIEKIKEFIDEFEIEYGKKPGTVSALSYDAFIFINECFKREKIKTREKMLSCMENLKEFEGVIGNYVFENHTPKRSIWILRPLDKDFETILEMKIE